MRHEWDFPQAADLSAAQSARVRDMAAALENERPQDVLTVAYQTYGSKLALVSSFGADSVVLLHMAAQLAPDFPIVFVDTGMLFEQTLEYQKTLATQLGLTNIKRVSPDKTVQRLADPEGLLHQTAPNDCCHVRKTLQLELALGEFDASVTGRKRYQTKARQSMDVVDQDHRGRVRFNPLATWLSTDVAAYMDAHDLPKHPLIARGYGSIGCAPCTTQVKAGEDPRAGRWRNTEKTECGIHFGVNGVVRG